MDNFDNHLKAIFSQLNSDEVPTGFSAGIMGRIAAEKERRIKRNEDLFQVLFITLSAIALVVSMILLNKYYFHVNSGFAVMYAKNYLSEVTFIFKSESVSSWSIIGINSIILILLEQFLSRKFSKKYFEKST